MEQGDRRRIVAVGAIGMAMGLAVVISLLVRDQQLLPRQVEAYAVPYDMRVLDDPFESLLARSDGQAFATLARDPLLRRAEAEFRTPGHAAYRAQRALTPYLAWAGSLGQPGWVPPALAVIAVVGTAGSAAAVGAMLEHRGRSPLAAAFVLLLPGFYASIAYFGPEPVALALAAWGVVAWERQRWWLAAALLALAGLGRETMLLVPGAMVLFELWQGRWRRLPPLLLTPLPYAMWVAVLGWRLGALPTDHGEGNLSMPLRGVLDGLAQPTLPGGEVWAAVLLGLAVWAVVVAPSDRTSWIAIAYVGLGLVMGELVWVSWEYFGRVLLPGSAFAVVAIIGATERFARPASDPDPAPLAAQEE